MKDQYKTKEDRSLWEKWGHVGVGGSDEPLTFEKMKQRWGKPIWVEPVNPNADWDPHWNILGDALYPAALCRRIKSTKGKDPTMLFAYRYGKDWIAYDWPPEGRTC